MLFFYDLDPEVVTCWTALYFLFGAEAPFFCKYARKRLPRWSSELVSFRDGSVAYRTELYIEQFDFSHWLMLTYFLHFEEAATPVVYTD